MNINMNITIMNIFQHNDHKRNYWYYITVCTYCYCHFVFGHACNDHLAHLFYLLKWPYLGSGLSLNPYPRRSIAKARQDLPNSLVFFLQWSLRSKDHVSVLNAVTVVNGQFRWLRLVMKSGWSVAHEYHEFCYEFCEVCGSSKIGPEKTAWRLLAGTI